MKESIGSAFVLNIIIVFVAIFISLYVGSLAYTKNFKVRNRIIDIIEKHGGYTHEAQEEIAENLRAIGYNVVDNVNCKNRSKSINLRQETNYNYCVYEYGSCVTCNSQTGECVSNSGCDNDRGTYYGVTVFMHFDIPLVGGFFNIPIYGETRIIYDKDKVSG